MFRAEACSAEWPRQKWPVLRHGDRLDLIIMMYRSGSLALASRTRMLWRLRLVGIGAARFDGINRKYWEREQFAGARDVLGPLAAGEQAIVADAVESRGQHVHQETADELVGGERHDLVPLGTFDPVDANQISAFNTSSGAARWDYM
jgi:hypothetical protein